MINNKVLSPEVTAYMWKCIYTQNQNNSFMLHCWCCVRYLAVYSYFHSFGVSELSQSIKTTLGWRIWWFTWWPTWRWAWWPTKKLAHMELDMVADMEIEKRNFMRLLAGLMSTRNKRENIKFWHNDICALLPNSPHRSHFIFILPWKLLIEKDTFKDLKITFPPKAPFFPSLVIFYGIPE